MAELLRRLHRRCEHLARAGADERGFGVPMALGVTLTAFVLGIVWSSVGIHGAERSALDRSRDQALYAAEAGVNAAMSALTTDASYAGGSGTLADQTGEWDVTVAPTNPSDPSNLSRIITATGYGPSRQAPRKVVRKLQAQVDLNSIDGFTYALFAGSGGITGANHMVVAGNVYGTSGVTLANNADIYGNVVSPGTITTSNNGLVRGNVQAGGNVTLENTSTTVQGSVYSGGNVSVHAYVQGDVLAAGSISVLSGGRVDGGVAPYSTPPPLPTQSLPTFTWNPANYNPAPTTWSTTSAFYSNWLTRVTAGLPFEGHHRITDTTALTLDRSWSMDTDVTIVADGKVTLTRQVTNAGSGIYNLVVVSLSSAGIELDNSVTIPDNVRVLLFAPNGPVVFRNLKHFTGAVYAQSITVDQNFTLTWAPMTPPGFSFANTSPVHYAVVVRVWREIPV